jgi:MFS transporter, MHS family, citrate/tricarballylate:H+ symporter
VTTTPKPFLTILRVTSGNFLEMYDFMIFGYYASWIAKAFFPAKNEIASLLLALATFGSGFLMRPLGAILLGGYTDRHGRRAGLLLTLSLMAFGTLSVACTPSYATIGLAAPLLVLAGRLLQGLSAGAELGSVSVYLAEIAPPDKKGFYVSWQSASQQIAVIFAAIIGIILVYTLSPATMAAWGWRIPLWIGCAVIPFLLWIRSSLAETHEFAARTHRPSAREVINSVARNWRLVTVGTLLTTLTTTTFYLITAYTPTFGSTTLHLSKNDALQVTLYVGLCNFAVLPIMGAVSDRIGRRILLWICTIAAVTTAYPAMLWLISQPTFTRLLLVELWFSLIFASYNGAMVVYLTEIMPPEIRATSFSLAYSTATALFGGFTPFICTWLIDRTGNRAAPGLWLSFAGVLALLAVAATRNAATLRNRTIYIRNKLSS